MINRIKQVCSAFRIRGELQSYEEIKCGHINQTYKVNFIRDDGKKKSYIVQAINTNVFRDPVRVMHNIDLVTEHLHVKAPDKKALHFHHTADRKTYWIGADGFWRLFNYIPSRTYDCSSDCEIVRNAGRAFGNFQQMLDDFDVELIHETIPFFHDTIKRYESLMNVVESDPVHRVSAVQEELNWLLEVQEQACRLTHMQRDGCLPVRVTHNDTKINNVLFEEDGKDAIVVIDLDTVMPGLVGHDFGDAIRSAANTEAEDCRETDKIHIDLKVFCAFTEGFLSKTAESLSKQELKLLPMSAFCMTCELAVRFLTDYLQGDTYFKVDYPEHNLIRTRSQIALAKDMLKNMDTMERITAEYAKLNRALKSSINDGGAL